ncbi:MAG: GTP cyclohydrolase II [Thermoplasmata archaeon]|nr:MAG: GTP cyclohydrolase II [Thermoplasmata archaeon]
MWRHCGVTSHLIYRGTVRPAVPIDKPTIEELIEHDKAHLCAGDDSDVCVKVVAIADFPSRLGDFQIVGFYNNHDDKDHIAVVKGDICDEEAVPVRLHSECLTGDVLGSKRCDCGEQLEAALRLIEEEGRGAILYMRQEGRGIGLINKIKAYQLQDFGLDTVEANVALGFEPDERDYAIAAHMLKSLHVKSVRLITNNPKKIHGLEAHNVEVVGRIPIIIDPNPHNKDYLRTKATKSGHLLDNLFNKNPE